MNSSRLYSSLKRTCRIRSYLPVTIADRDHPSELAEFPGFFLQIHGLQLDPEIEQAVTAEDIDPDIAGYLEDTVLDHPVDPGAYRILGNGQLPGNQFIGFAAVFQVADNLDIDWVDLHAGRCTLVVVGGFFIASII